MAMHPFLPFCATLQGRAVSCHQMRSMNALSSSVVSYSFQHMVQNQMTPSYPAFSQTASLEEFQQQQQQQQQAAAQSASQQPAAQSPATASDPQFKTSTEPSPTVSTVTNGVEQQTVSAMQTDAILIHTTSV